MRTLQSSVEQPGFVPIKIADDRILCCRRLIGIYNQAISVEDEYGGSPAATQKPSHPSGNYRN